MTPADRHRAGRPRDLTVRLLHEATEGGSLDALGLIDLLREEQDNG